MLSEARFVWQRQRVGPLRDLKVHAELATFEINRIEFEVAITFDALAELV